MSEYTVTVVWRRPERAVFTDNRYSRDHTWRFDGGTVVQAAASPHIVPPPLTSPANVDPEEAFVASLSSCHMLFFLSIAAKRGLVVDAYTDEAVGTLAKNAQGQLAMTHVALHPRVTYAGAEPDAATEDAIHHEAHEACFIANSVKSEVTVKPARLSSSERA